MPSQVGNDATNGEAAVGGSAGPSAKRPKLAAASSSSGVSDVQAATKAPEPASAATPSVPSATVTPAVPPHPHAATRTPDTAETAAATAMAFLAPALNPASEPLGSTAAPTQAQQQKSTNEDGSKKSKRAAQRPKFKGPIHELEPAPIEKQLIELGKVYSMRGIPKTWDGRQWRKICLADWCARYAVSSGHCKAHGGGHRCAYKVLQVANNGARDMVNCLKSAVGKTAYCKAHGGGKRCAVQTANGKCPKSAAGNTEYCKAHGGGKRCTAPGCSKSAVSPTTTCINHGGGKRCSYIRSSPASASIVPVSERTCGKSARGPTGFCITHCASGQCSVKDCEKTSLQGTWYCQEHVEIQGHYDERMALTKQQQLQQLQKADRVPLRSTTTTTAGAARSALPAGSSSASLGVVQQQQQQQPPQSRDQAQLQAQAQAGLSAMSRMSDSASVAGGKATNVSSSRGDAPPVDSYQAMQRTHMAAALWQQQQQQPTAAQASQRGTRQSTRLQALTGQQSQPPQPGPAQSSSQQQQQQQQQQLSARPWPYSEYAQSGSAQ